MLRTLRASLIAVLVLAASPAAAAPWTDLGGGLAGVAGIPGLTGLGALSPGTPGALALNSAAPSAPCLLFFSFLEVPVPFKGGTLSAYPPIGMWMVATDPAGRLLLPWTAWPSGLPAGLELFIQAAVSDAAAVHGASISNLLRGVVQP